MRTPRQPREIESTGFAAALAACLWLVDPASAQCEPGWTGEFGGNGLDSWAWSLVWFDDGHGPAMFAGGFLQSAGGIPVNGAARWNGTEWTPADQGLADLPVRLGVLDVGAGPALHAATGNGGYRVWRWDGLRWTAVSAILYAWGLFGYPTPPAVYDDGAGPRIYLGSADLAPHYGETGQVARLDGTSWTVITPNHDTSFYDLAVFNDGTGARLYAAGFRSNSWVPTEGYLGCWDGTTWTTIATPQPATTPGDQPSFTSLIPYSNNGEPTLVAGGRFSVLGGVRASNVAAWDGSAWSALGQGVSGGNQTAWSLGIHDDGTGPALYIGGPFTHAGGRPATGVARWDGSAWSPLGTGVGPAGGYPGAVYAMASAGPARGLYVGGNFATAGGLPSDYVARWACACYPDCDNSGTLALADFSCFQSQFVAGHSYSDCNGDGRRTVADFGCFQTEFVRGCP